MLPTYGQPIVRSDPQTFPDNIKLFFGDEEDASIFYDGSDLIINPNEEGSGSLRIEGDIVVDGNFNLLAGSFDLNSQGGLLNIGAAGNDWTATVLQIASAHAGTTIINVSNTQDSADASAAIRILVGGEVTTGDPFMKWTIAFADEWLAGIDNSAGNRFAISLSGRLGTNDALRISATTPPVVTYNSAHPTGTFDYVCESCGQHEAEAFTCCGPVAWRDDNADFRALVLGKPGALEYMEKIGVMERTFNNDGDPEVFTKLGPDWMFVGSMAYQNRQRIDRHYDELDRRLKKVGV